MKKDQKKSITKDNLGKILLALREFHKNYIKKKPKK